jgi:hypothetical protein
MQTNDLRPPVLNYIQYWRPEVNGAKLRLEAVVE